MKTRNFILIGALVIQGLTVSSQALQPEVLYEFQQAPAFPEARLVEGPDRYFYGTTSSGGSGGAGTVFKVNTDGVLTTHVSFNGTDGAKQGAALMLGSDGNFYGTTDRGGIGRWGHARA